jgi:hypothetical protein
MKCGCWMVAVPRPVYTTHGGYVVHAEVQGYKHAGTEVLESSDRRQYVSVLNFLQRNALYFERWENPTACILSSADERTTQPAFSAQQMREPHSLHSQLSRWENHTACILSSADERTTQPAFSAQQMREPHSLNSQLSRWENHTACILSSADERTTLLHFQKDSRLRASKYCNIN